MQGSRRPVDALTVGSQRCTLQDPVRDFWGTLSVTKTSPERFSGGGENSEVIENRRLHRSRSTSGRALVGTARRFQASGHILGITHVLKLFIGQRKSRGYGISVRACDSGFGF